MDKFQKVLDWTVPYFPEEVRKEASLVYKSLVNNTSNPNVDYYTTELEFGTGGIRGLLGYGPGRMNIWTIGRVSTALVRTLGRGIFKKKKLVIAYDSRRMSLDFAKSTAGIAAKYGVEVYLFDKPTPTPILSYATRKLKASAGIVITASHNPPEFNGYKVYNKEGAQIVDKEQKLLEREIAKIKSYSKISFLDTEEKKYKKKVQYLGDEILEDYKKDIQTCNFVSSASNPKKKELKIIYTPLHGTGDAWLPPLLKSFGFSVESVAEQAKADGEFPTVKYPNPEEKEALKKAEELAQKREAQLFLATDPDADRLGIGVRNDEGSYTYLNGNQIGSILLTFLCEKENFSTKTKRAYKSIVTTDLHRKIAEKHKVKLEDILTGFKYVAQKIQQFPEEEYLFGSEESYGYLPVSFVRDKDSLSSALLLAEIATEKNLLSYLDEIYLNYGLYLERLESITLKGEEGKKKIENLMQDFRPKNPKEIKELNGKNFGGRSIKKIIDYKEQKINQKEDLDYFSDFSISNVLQFLLEPEAKISIRPSGTEPKIKIYISIAYSHKIIDLESLKEAKILLKKELEVIKKDFFTLLAC